MLRRKKAKIAALVIALFMIFAYIMDDGSLKYALLSGNPLYTHFTYQFLHANILHLAINLYCFIAVIFLFDVSFVQIAACYILSAMVPESVHATVGVSGVCLCLYGMVMWKSVNRLQYNVYLIIFFAIGFIFPNSCNSMLHVICYGYGCLYGYLLKLWKR